MTPTQPSQVDDQPTAVPQDDESQKLTNLEAEPSPSTQSDAAPAQATQPTPPSSIQSPKKRGKLVAIIIAVVVVLLLAGAAVAYKFWYQSPNKVLGDALIHALDTNTATTVNGTASAGNDDASFSSTIAGSALKGQSTADATLKLTLKSGEYKGETFDLKGSTMLTSDGTIYFKATDIKQLANKLIDMYVKSAFAQYEDAGYELSAADKAKANKEFHTQFDPIVEKFDGQWIKVAADDLKSQGESTADEYKCFNDAVKHFQNQAEVRELGDVYQKNQFIKVTKELGAKDGSLGYELAIDKDKAKAFGKASDNTAIAKAFNKCDDKNKSTTDTTEATDEAADNTETKSFQVWVSRWTHQFTRVVYSGVVKDSSDAKTDVNIDMKFDYSKPVTISAPDSAKSIDDVLKELEAFGAGSPNGTV